jgi:glucose-6-phosphate isomerase
MDALSQFIQQTMCFDSIGFTLDESKILKTDAIEKKLDILEVLAFNAMDALEHGAIANATEGRMVGHYWLRAPHLAPQKELSCAIEDTLKAIRGFVEKIFSGEISSNGKKFTHLLCIGIGGSALGPQLITSAFSSPLKGLKITFLDNTDPIGFNRRFCELREHLDTTLFIVTSKSGSTPEPHNAMIATAEFFHQNGLNFSRHSVAISCEGSILWKQSREENWIATFPMWDWVGGRTSITSVVGLLPAALAGISIDEFLNGAAAMDEFTRSRVRNPAMHLARCWYHAGGGRGTRNRVVLPYCDSLELLTRYLQQLVMESIGKRLDRHGNIVHQGLSVYGNKGSTDQHAYVQQLRDGNDDFFVTFIEILRHGSLQWAGDIAKEAGVYLEGFLLGTRAALSECGRQSITLTLRELTPIGWGALIALNERTVGFYAELIDVNAYDQPGVEAGKKAASAILDLKKEILNFAKEHSLSIHSLSAEKLIHDLGRNGKDGEMIFKILEFLKANA